MNRSHLILVVGLACGFSACRGGAKEPAANGAEQPAAKTPKDQIVLTAAEQAAGHIETQPAALVDTPELVRASGRIARADDRTWRVGVRAEGLVTVVLANLGDAVTKRQVLARYHADEVREERAKYRVALSELRRVQAAAAQVQRNYERAQTLLALKAGSVAQVEQARQDVVTAQETVRKAQIEVDRGQDVLEDDLSVPADPKEGAEGVDEVPIYAPEAGYVLEKNVTPGRTIAPGQDAFVIGDLSQVWMLASIRQELLSQLHVGRTVRVSVAGLDGPPFDGTLSNLGQELDPITRVMPVRIVLKNPRHRLRPEMLATAEIPIGSPKSRLTVPSDAVQQVAGQDVVFVRTSPDRFVLRAVRVGPTTGGRTPVLEGVAAGEQVVVQGSFVLKSHLLRSTIEGD